MKGKYIINTMKKKDYKEGITLVLTCSKMPILPFFFKSLRDMDLPRENMHLLIYDNTSDPLYLEKLQDEIDELMCPKCRQFRSIRLYKSNRKPRGSLTGSGNEKFSASKIYNIWMMWKKIYHMVYTDTFFQLEDDTIVEPDTFNKLYKILLSDKKIGFVTAIETGRNSAPYMPTRVGVHKITMRKGRLLVRDSFDPNTKGIVEIDSSGVYCFVARSKAYKSGFIDYEAPQKAFSLFAMDNVLTYNMKRHGWKLFADFSCWCGHLQISGGRICIFGKEQALKYIDLYIPKYDCYAISMEVKKHSQPFRTYAIKTPAPCFSLHPEEETENNDAIAAEIKKAKEKSKKQKKRS